MSYREPAPHPCASGRCTKLVSDGPEPGGTASGDPNYCSWGCLTGAEVRAMWAGVKRAKEASARARLWV